MRLPVTETQKTPPVAKAVAPPVGVTNTVWFEPPSDTGLKYGIPFCVVLTLSPVTIAPAVPVQPSSVPVRLPPVPVSVVNTSQAASVIDIWEGNKNPVLMLAVAVVLNTPDWV